MSIKLKCRFYFSDKNSQCKVTIIQKKNGINEARIYPNSDVRVSFQDSCSLESEKTGQGLILKKTPVYLTQINEKFSLRKGSISLKGHMAQAVLESSSVPDNSDQVAFKIYLTNFPALRIRGGYGLKINGHNISIKPFQKSPASHMAIIEKVLYGQKEEIIEMMKIICWISSFASGMLSGIYKIEIFKKNDIIYQMLSSPDIKLNRSILPIVHDQLNLNLLVNFVENTFPTYKRSNSEYPLANLINIGILAKHSEYKESKFLLMCNFLEVLRYNYALNIGVHNGVFSQDGDNFNWVTGKNTGKKASFKEILEHFCNSINLLGWDDDFRDLRNEIIHTGKIKGNSWLTRYQNLHHFCDRVILAILEWDHYNGQYLPIDNINKQGKGITAPNWMLFKR